MFLSLSLQKKQRPTSRNHSPMTTVPSTCSTKLNGKQLSYSLLNKISVKSLLFSRTLTTIVGGAKSIKCGSQMSKLMRVIIQIMLDIHCKCPN